MCPNIRRWFFTCSFTERDDVWDHPLIPKVEHLNICDCADLCASTSGYIDRLINRAAGAVWRIYRRGNRVSHAGQEKGKTDSSRSIKQRANNKCVRDGRAAAINVKSIISLAAGRSDHNRALQVGCYDREYVSAGWPHYYVFRTWIKAFMMTWKQVDGETF